MLPTRSLSKALIYRPQRPLAACSRYLCAKKTNNNNNKSNNVDMVITSAVRTPIANFQTMDALQLGALAIEAAWKQSAVPREFIQQIYMCTAAKPDTAQQMNKPLAGEEDIAKQAAKKAGLLKPQCNTLHNNSIDALKMAKFDLEGGRAEFIIAGVMESLSNSTKQLNVSTDVSKTPAFENSKMLQNDLQFNTKELHNYHSECCSRTTMAMKNGVFDSEIVPVYMRNKRAVLVKNTDELMQDHKLAGRAYLDGAAAMVLTTAAIAEQHNLRPLARIVDCEGVATNDYNTRLGPVKAVEYLFLRTGLNVKDIQRWEVHATTPAVTLAFAKTMRIDAKNLNLYGVGAALANPYNLAGFCVITHLAHTLKTGEMGCAVISNDADITSAVLLEKLPAPTINQLPMLTLFTKKNCPLCDNLTEELDSLFPGAFELEKVFIDEEANSHFLKLYRNDIPVLFLNGQFVCMHKLNIGLIRNRLKQLNQELS